MGAVCKNLLAGAVALSAATSRSLAQCDPPPPLVQFAGLGEIGVNTYSQATAISANGSVVIGFAANGPVSVAFRWTQSGGMQSLGVLSGDTTATAYAVNADGTLIVGDSSQGNSNYRPFRWTQSAGMQLFDQFPAGTYFYPRGVSADGSLAVGLGGDSSFHAAYWTAAGGVHVLHSPPGYNDTYVARGVSADGTVIVGDPAFRWTAASGMLFFTPLSEGANGVSADGEVAVGYSSTAGGLVQDLARRWLSDGSSSDLRIPLEPGINTIAKAVNGDGSVLVGLWGWHPLLWTQGMGPLELDQFLVAHNANLDSWALGPAVGVSEDGTTIIGNGTHVLPNGSYRDEAWMATVSMLLTVRPTERVTCQGHSESFDVRLVGTTPPFTFTWRRNGVPLTGGRAVATTSSDGLGSTLSITDVNSSDQALYDCAIADTACRYISTPPFSLRVNSADFNGDGDLGTDQDIEAFFACLAGSCCPTCGTADFNADSNLGTDADIEAFFRVLAGGNC